MSEISLKPVVRILVVALFVVALALVVPVTIAWLGFRAPFDVHEVEFQADVAVQPASVHVRGHTNLISGSVVTCQVWRAEDELSGAANPYIEETTASVISGAFECAIDVHTWPGGPIRIDTRFDPSDAVQPTATVGAYGRRGERLAGPQVVRDSGGWIIDVFESRELER